MKLQQLFYGLALTATLFSACGGNKADNAQTAKPIENTTTPTKQTAAVYACPMDCEKGKTYSEVGKCPVCKMDLVLKDDKVLTK
jgi:uncharacterized paraquat-inducible protein A